MKRTAVMMAIALLASAGSTYAAQESVGAGTTSPVQGGKVMKSKTMTASGVVKTAVADSLIIADGTGKEWTFVVDATTKVLPRTGQESVDVTPVSPVEGGQKLPSTKFTMADVKSGQRVQVTYHTKEGKMHATTVRMM